MSTTFTILLIGYLLASYIYILYVWLNFKKKLKTDIGYMPLQIIISEITSKIDFFKSTEWKIYLVIAFLLLAPFIFIFTLFSMPRNFIKKLKKKKQPVEVPKPIPPAGSVDVPEDPQPLIT